MPPPASDLEKGLAALARGSLVVARDALQRAVADAPFDVVARHNLAVVERLRGALSTAWTHADAAAELCAPDERSYPVVRSHLALIDRLMGERERSNEGVLAALRSAPSHRVSLAYRGLFARLDGALSIAIEHWRAALASGPEPPLPRLVRARLEGMIDDAIALGVDRVEPATRGASAIGAITELLAHDGAARLVDEAPLTAPLGSLATGDGTQECTASEAAALVHRARRIVVLTGAGCSAQSGLATRKDLWKRFDKDDAVSITHGSLAMLWRVLEDFLGTEEAQPNPAHDVIASLPRVTAIVTQNVDDLHQRAAREDLDPVPILELHGTLERTRCHACGADRGARTRSLLRQELPPRCPSCGQNAVRPDVVLFGEWLPRAALDESVRLVSQCDLLLIVGCAMDVAPASELPRIARESGATVIEVKRSASRVSRPCATKLLRGDAATALAELYGELAEREDVLPLRGQRQREPPTPAAGSGRFVDVSLPAAYESMVEGVVARWLRLPGSRVEANEALCEVELDKTTVEVPAPVAGTLRSVLVPEGELAQVDQRIARIELPTDAASSEAPVSVPRPSEPERWPGPRMHRAKDPFAVPLGAFTDATRQLLQLVCSAPLLQPDATLARGDDEALISVRDRADELAAALGLDEPLRVEIFRDPVAAAEEEVTRWIDALAPPAPLAQRWMGFAREDGPARDSAVKRAATIAATRATDRSARRLGGFATMPIDAFSKVVQGAIASVAARGPTPATPCRFRPLLSLWLRGAWPFALPDALGLWVPLYANATLVAAGRLSADPIRAARWRESPQSPLAGARWPRSPAEWYRVE